MRGTPRKGAEVHQPLGGERVMDRTNEGIEVKVAQQTAEIRRAAPEVAQDSVVALVDQSRLRRECLKLALTEHEPAWRILDLGSAEDVLRLAEGGQKFDLLLLGAATAELVDLAQVEMLHQALPETPIVVVAENDNPHPARLILNARTRGFLPASLSPKRLLRAPHPLLPGPPPLPPPP